MSTRSLIGCVILLGGPVRTGEESKVRIDLTEGTIVRLAAMSEFTLSELNDDPANPFTRLSLAMGKLWVILNGGSLEVQTEARPMTESEVQEWIEDNPEAFEVIPTPQGTPERAPEATNEGTPEAAPEATPPPLSGPPILDPAQPRTQPLSYDIKNECAAEGAGRVTFDGPVTVVVDIPRGERRSGQLPPGVYRLTVSLPDVNATFGPYPADSDAGPVTFDICGDQPPGAGPGREGGGPFTYTLTNNCPDSMGTVHVTFSGPETRTVDIPPGQTASGELPPGDYTISVRADDGTSGEPFQIPREAWPIVHGMCDDGPPPPPGTPFPGGTPFAPGPNGQYVNTQPLRYNLNHNCAPDTSAGTWVWTFQRLDDGQVFTVELQPGESKSGELPPGRYSVSDRDATGPLGGPTILDSDFTVINISHCP